MLPFPIISNLREQSSYRVSKFIAGYDHIAVLGTNGELYTRGQNTYGQLGDSSMVSNNQTWQLSMTDVSSLYGSKSQNTIIIKNDGTVWYCGRTTVATQFGYNNGQSTVNGVNSWTEITSYIPFSSTLIKDIVVFYQGSAIVRTDGLVYFCGVNTSGMFGMNNTSNLTVYTQSLATDVQYLYTQHPISTCNVMSYLDSSNHIWACGNNSAKQVSSSSTTSFSTFQSFGSYVGTPDGVAICGSTSWYVVNNTGYFCGNALTLQGTNSGVLFMYSATGNQSSGLTKITSSTVSGTYGIKTTNIFWAKTFYSGGASESPLMNNQSNRANWLQQHTMPTSLGTYSGMEIGYATNAYLLFLSGPIQEIMGIGMMTSSPSSSVYEKIILPDFQ